MNLIKYLATIILILKIQPDFFDKNILLKIIKENEYLINDLPKEVLSEDNLNYLLENFDDSCCYTNDLFSIIPKNILTQMNCEIATSHITYHHAIELFENIPYKYKNERVILNIARSLGCNYMNFLTDIDNELCTEKLLVKILNDLSKQKNIYYDKQLIINMFNKFTPNIHERYIKRIKNIINKCK